MKWLFRWAFRLLILLVVLIVAAILLLDTIARELTEHRLRRQTGLDVKIGHLQLSIWNSTLTLENVVIYNSAEFGGAPMIDVPELHLEYNRSPLLYEHFHFKLIRLNLTRLNVVEDLNGRRNIDVLVKKMQKPARVSTSASDTDAKKYNKPTFLAIDTMALSLGGATYTQMKNPAAVDELKLDIRDQIFSNIKNEADLQGVGMVLLLKSGTPLLGNQGKHWLDLIALGPPAKK